MFTAILSGIIALLKAIPEIIQFWKWAEQKREKANAIEHREQTRVEDDAAVDAAIASNRVPEPESKAGEQQKNPHDFFPGVD